MNTPTPLLFYAPYSQNFTGAPRVFLNLLEQLDQTQFRPICVSQRESLLTAQLHQQGFETIIIPFPKILDVYNEGIFSYTLTDKLKSAKALFEYNQQIAQLGQQYQVQGIWGRNVKSILLIGMAARQLGVPLIWDIGMEKESRGFMKVLHWLGLSLSTVVVTQAASQPKDIFDPLAAKLFAAKFMTISPGVGLDRLTSLHLNRNRSRVSKHFTILSVGTISPRKNQLMLLRAVATLVSQYSQIRVRIVGPVTDESYFATCQEFVRIKNLAPYVEFLGWCDDVPELMHQSDLFVLCSNNEGVPYVIREAMHASMPIIATNVGGVPDTIDHGKTGFLVEKDDVDQLCHWIEYCLTQAEICASIGRRAFEAAEQKFSVTEWSAKYNSLLRQLSSQT